MMNKLKKYKLFRPLILSRHPSHSILRAKNQTLPLLPFRSVIRLGSTTESDGRLEINTAQAVKNSASKLLMKQKFTEAGVKTAQWGKSNTARFDRVEGIYWVQHEAKQFVR